MNHEGTIDLAAARRLVADPAGMDAGAVADVLGLLLDGSLAEADGGALLAAWSQRGETAAELAALVRLLRERAVRVPVAAPSLDLCGTGGTGLTRFNISTTAAFVLAAAGIPVAKHGNLGSRRPNGSFNLLAELGCAYELPPEALAELQAETGVCFIFARTHHPAVGTVVPYRKAAGGRTIFNLAGPLANPAALRCQLIGVADPALAPVIADALRELAVERALVVHGEPGIDELSVVGASRWWQIDADAVRPGGSDTVLVPDLQHDELPGGDAPANAATFARLLDGSETGPLHEMLCVNAGAAIDCWHGRAPELTGPGYRQAKELLASGAVHSTFERHRDLSRRLTG